MLPDSILHLDFSAHFIQSGRPIAVISFLRIICSVIVTHLAHGRSWCVCAVTAHVSNAHAVSGERDGENWPAFTRRYHSGECSGLASYKTVLLIALCAVVHLKSPRIDGIGGGCCGGLRTILLRSRFRSFKSIFFFGSLWAQNSTHVNRLSFGWARCKCSKWQRSKAPAKWNPTRIETELGLDAYCALSSGAMAKGRLDGIGPE